MTSQILGVGRVILKLRNLLTMESHWHWDHIGDPSSFPHSTDLIVGPGFKEAFLPAAPLNPDSPLQEKDWA